MFLVFTNILVIRHLYKLRIILLWRSKTADISFSIHASSVSAQSEPPSKSFSSLQNALFLNAFYLAVQQIIIESIPVVFTILSFCNLFRYDVGSVSRIYHMFTVVMLNGLNPCMAILTIKALRETVTGELKIIGSICARPKMRS